MKITDTSKHPHHEWPLGGKPQAILQQEAAGQGELVQGTQLPVEIDGIRGLSEAGPLVDAGVMFGSICEDELFREATLPPGWKKVATDHSMWTDLVDEGGQVRASIFYKAAFYDRGAALYVKRHVK